MLQCISCSFKPVNYGSRRIPYRSCPRCGEKLSKITESLKVEPKLSNDHEFFRPDDTEDFKNMVFYYMSGLFDSD